MVFLKKTLDSIHQALLLSCLKFLFKSGKLIHLHNIPLSRIISLPILKTGGEIMKKMIGNFILLGTLFFYTNTFASSPYQQCMRDCHSVYNACINGIGFGGSTPMDIQILCSNVYTGCIKGCRYRNTNEAPGEAEQLQEIIDGGN